MKKRIIVYIFLGSLFSMFVTGCKKFVDLPLPLDQEVAGSVFNDDNSAISALNGLYSNMIASPNLLCSGGLTLYGGLSADELLSTDAGNPETNQFFNNTLLPDNSVLANNFWRSSYNLIYHCNAILEGVNHSSGISPAVKQRLVSEALFIRSFYFLQLSALFGEIPLTVSTDYNANAVLPQSALPDIYSQIEMDLHESIDLFVVAGSVIQPGYPSIWAAKMLLARVYCYTGDWQKILDLTTEIMNSGIFSLNSDLSSVFKAGSPESVWEMIPVESGLNTYEAANFIPSDTTVIPRYILRDSLVNSFAETDLRKLVWTGFNTVDGIKYFYPAKYKVTYDTQIDENYVLLRYAELFLLRAEAKALLNDPESACADINVIRERAGLDDFNSTSQVTILSEIQTQQRKEFFCEEGHRWLDLKRSGRAIEVLSADKAQFQPRDTLYPLPVSEIIANPRLRQNPGY